MHFVPGDAVVDKKDLLLALGFFKDWSNFMLVTTVAALGWTAKVETTNAGCRCLQMTSMTLFALSIAFAVFTLALVPLIAEKIAGGGVNSIYEVEAKFYVLPDFFPRTLTDGLPRELKLKSMCWLQHVLFLLGVAFYALWSFTRLPSTTWSMRRLMCWTCRTIRARSCGQRR